MEVRQGVLSTSARLLIGCLILQIITYWSSSNLFESRWHIQIGDPFNWLIITLALVIYYSISFLGLQKRAGWKTGNYALVMGAFLVFIAYFLASVFWQNAHPFRPLLSVTAIALFLIFAWALHLASTWKGRALPGTSHGSGIIFRTAWTLMFILTVLCSLSFDLLDKDFETSGIRLLVFNLSRLGFVVFLGFSFFQAGRIMVKVAIRFRPGFSLHALGLSSLELGCFLVYVGAAVLNLFFFFLGLAQLYYSWILLLIFLPLVWGSASAVGPCLGFVFNSFGSLTRNGRFLQLFPICLMISFVLVGAAFLVLIKGVWPGGAGGDTYSHYLPFYRAIMQDHGIVPNDVWYHYFVSKGACLFFAAMALSNELGGQLVSLLFFFFTCSLLYLVVCRLIRNRAGALCAVGIYEIVFVKAQEWAIFLKHHEMMTSWILFIFWAVLMIGRLGKLAKAELPGLFFLLAFVVVTFVLQFPTAFGLILPFFTICGVWYFFTGRRAGAVLLGLLVVVGALFLSALVAFNQLRTGIGMETPWRIAWQHANLPVFARWVSPYLATYLTEGSGSGVGAVGFNLGSLFDVDWFFRLFRLQEIGFHFHGKRLGQILGMLALLTGALLVKTSFFTNRTSLDAVGMQLKRGYRIFGFTSARLDIMVCAFALCLVGWLMANVVNQPVSIYRMFSFIFALSILASFCLWMVLFRLFRSVAQSSRNKYANTAILALAYAFPFYWASPTQHLNMDLRPYLKFAAGICSAEQTLGDPALLQTEVWPPYLRARKLIPSTAPVLYFGINGNFVRTSFAFPGAGLESEVSYALGPNWHKIVFDDPETAMIELKRIKINYFMIDLTQYQFGGVPFSPLFRPENIGKYFNLVFNDQGVWLLTWKDDSHTPLTDDQIVLWDIVRNGVLSPLASPAAQAKIAHALDDKQIWKDEIISSAGGGISAASVKDLMSRVKDALRPYMDTRVSDYVMAGMDSKMSVVCANFPKRLSPKFRQYRAQILVTRYISGRLHALYYEAIHGSDLAKERFFDDPNHGGLKSDPLEDDGEAEVIASNGTLTARYRDLYQLVDDIYVYNQGNLTHIVRKPGLPKTDGWQ